MTGEKLKRGLSDSTGGESESELKADVCRKPYSRPDGLVMEDWLVTKEVKLIPRLESGP